MSGIRVEGNTSGNVAEVDASNQLKVTPPLATAIQTTPSITPGIGAYTVADEGAVTGAPTINSPITTSDDRLLAGVDTPIFDYAFNATAQDTGVWACKFTTMTITEGSGSALFNANSTATTTTGCALYTFRTFSMLGAAALRGVFVGSITAVPLANQMIELGFFLPTPTTTPVDGVYFRYTSAGLLGVLNYNGVETTTSVFNLTPITGSATALAANQNYAFAINVTRRGVEFWLADILLGIVAVPAANGFPFLENALPFAVQQRNPGTVSGSPQMQFKWASGHVTQREVSLALPVGHLMAGMGRAAYAGLNGGAMGTLALYSNSLAAGAGAVMTNTAASLGTGLGGQFSALPTLAAGTDGILCSYQNPAGGVNQTPRTLVITGVKVHGIVTTILAGGPVLYAYSLAYGHTSVSMATGEGASFSNATTKAPRRIPLGLETYAATAAVGVVGSPGGIYMSFEQGPVVVNPGEFIAVCAKNIGTVTTTGVITVLVTFEGYYL